MAVRRCAAVAAMAARNGGVAAAAAAIPVESNSRREMGMNIDRLPTSLRISCQIGGRSWSTARMEAFG